MGALDHGKTKGFISAFDRRGQSLLVIQSSGGLSGSCRKTEDVPVPETPTASVTARRSRQVEGEGDGTSRVRSRSQKTGKGGKIPLASGAFVTPPSSWVKDEAAKEEGRGRKKSGEAAGSDDSLQRVLEKEVVDLLHQENQQRKKELTALKQEKKVQKELEQRVQREMAKREAERAKDDGSVESWTKVKSEGGGSQLPPPPATPKTAMMWTMPEESRFTPGGTRVPDGIPPQDGPVVPPPPSWMCGDLEFDQMDHCRGEIGYLAILGLLRCMSDFVAVIGLSMSYHGIQGAGEEIPSRRKGWWVKKLGVVLTMRRSKGRSVDFRRNWKINKEKVGWIELWRLDIGNRPNQVEVTREEKGGTEVPITLPCWWIRQ